MVSTLNKKIFDIELVNIKDFVKAISWVNDRQKNMGYNLICKKSIEDLLSYSKYKKTDLPIMNCLIFVNYVTKIIIINDLFQQTLRLKENSLKSNLYCNYLRIENQREYKNKRLDNDKFEIQNLKQKYMHLIYDIENLRVVNKEMTNLIELDLEKDKSNGNFNDESSN